MIINNIPVYTLQHVNFGSYVVRHGSQPFNTPVNDSDFKPLSLRGVAGVQKQQTPGEISESPRYAIEAECPKSRRSRNSVHESAAAVPQRPLFPNFLFSSTSAVTHRRI